MESDAGRDHEITGRSDVVVKERKRDIRVEGAPLRAECVPGPEDVELIPRWTRRGNVGVRWVEFLIEMEHYAHLLRAAEEDLIDRIVVTTAHEEIMCRALQHVFKMRRSPNRPLNRREGWDIEPEFAQLVEHVPRSIVANPFRVGPRAREQSRFPFIDFDRAPRLA